MICPLCHSFDSKIKFSANNLHGHHLYGKEKIVILECQECLCIYPKVKIDSNFYKKYYPKKYQHLPTFFEKILLTINLYIKKRQLPLNCSLLDVGCGTGEFIKSLPANINAIGIDIQAPKTKNLTIIQADFLKYKFIKKFDVITFWHSLEHFPNPHETVNKALKLLNPSGKIFIALPNTNSLAFKLGQKNWFHLDAPRHLFLPNNENIKLLFPKNYSVDITYPFHEFPLDLFWSLKNNFPLRMIYPFLKVFDRENMTIRLRKISYFPP